MSAVLAIGVDPSLTCTGVAGVLAIDGEVQQSVALALRPPKSKRTGLAAHLERLVWFRDQFRHYFWGPGLVEWFPQGLDPSFRAGGSAGLHGASNSVSIRAAVEDYAYSRSNALTGLGEVGGIVRLALVDARIPFTVVSVGSLKKFISGKGNVGKDEIRLAAFKRFEIESDTVDQVEAECLALMLLAGLKEIELDLPKPHLEALSKVEWPHG